MSAPRTGRKSAFTPTLSPASQSYTVLPSWSGAATKKPQLASRSASATPSSREQLEQCENTTVGHAPPVSAAIASRIESVTRRVHGSGAASTNIASASWRSPAGSKSTSASLGIMVGAAGYQNSTRPSRSGPKVSTALAWPAA